MLSMPSQINCCCLAARATFLPHAEPVWRFFGTVVVTVNSWLKIGAIRLSHRGCTGGLSHSSRSAEEHDSLRPQTNAQQSQGAAPPAAKRFISLYSVNRNGSFFAFTHTDDFFFFPSGAPSEEKFAELKVPRAHFQVNLTLGCSHAAQHIPDILPPSNAVIRLIGADTPNMLWPI